MPRPKKRKRRPPPPDAFRPWECVVLSVDPGTHCGAAIFQRGAYYDSVHGDGFDPAFMAQCIDNALFVATQLELPLVLVVERPPRGGAPYAGRSPEGVASVIASRKLWARAWQQEPRTVNRMRVDVYPQTWRARVLGLTTGPMLERAELMRASHLAGKDMVSRDEAAAVLMGEWGSRGGPVGTFVRPTTRRCA